MEIAALVSFAILIVAWIVAPDGPRAPAPAPTPEVETPLPEAQPATA